MATEGLQDQTLVSVEHGLVNITSVGDEALSAELHVPHHPHLQVLCNQAPVYGRLSVRSKDQIQVLLTSVPMERRADVSVHPDGLTATLAIHYVTGWQRGLVPFSPTPWAMLEVSEVEQRPLAYTRDEIDAILQTAGVVFGIDNEAIDAFLAQQSSGTVVCAHGQAAVEGEEERYEILVTEPLEKVMVGIIPVRSVLSVRADTMFGIHRMATPGVPGTDVFGKVVPLRTATVRLQKLGQGVVEDQEGGLWSVRAGRIILTNRILDVAQTLEIEGNLVALEGHIVFDGDVLVRGDVSEGVHVTSGGQVFVGGSVSNARIRADAGITVHGGVFQSTLEAGTRAQALRALDTILRDISYDLTQFVQSVAQVESSLHSYGKSAELSRISTMLLDSKFEHLLKWPEEIQAWRSTQGSAAGSTTLQWVDLLMREFTRGRLTTVREVAHWRQWLVQLDVQRNAFVEVSESTADIQCKYGQNSKFVATGSIVCTGQGFYQCGLSADIGVRVQGTPGVLMGCTIHTGSVDARDIGSQAGTRTTIHLLRRDGYVKANQIYEGTSLNIGSSWHHLVSKDLKNVTWP